MERGIYPLPCLLSNQPKHAFRKKRYRSHQRQYLEKGRTVNYRDEVTTVGEYLGRSRESRGT